MKTLPLPGAVGVTDLRVYDTAAPDGLVGGGPHIHLTCTEAYCVASGRGRVQTLGPDGILREIILEPQKIVWFSPGVIHRLINEGDLRLLIYMQNAGLPEAGDFVLTFPRETLADAEKYAAAASIAASGHVYASGEVAARNRRDLAVKGFLELQDRIKTDGAEKVMRDFYELALARVSSKLSAWRDVWKNGPLAVANETGRQLDALEQGNFEHLFNGRVSSLLPPAGDRKLGMCGSLGVYLPEGINA